MAERTGVPALDNLIEGWLSNPPLDLSYPFHELRQTRVAAGECSRLTEKFLNFAAKRGVDGGQRRDSTSWGLGLAHTAHDASHTVAEFTTLQGIYYVDWTSAQFDVFEFPHCRKLVQLYWKAEW